MIVTALRLHSLKISVAPIIPNTKMFDARAMSERGYTLADLKDTLPSVDDLEHWFGNGSNKRLAVICKSVICLDFDLWPLYLKFKREYPTFSYTWTVRTAKGAHLYYRVGNSDIGKLKCNWNNTEIKYGGLAIITAGKGYETIENGLANKLTILRLEDALALPIVSTPLPAVVAPSLRSVALLQRKGNNNAASSFPLKKGKAEGRAVSEANEVLITDYLTSLGHTIRVDGKGWITNCPFPQNHNNNDADPSFWILDSTDKQMCNCFKSGCASDKAMDYINLYARINNISNGEAYKLIRNIEPKETTKDRRARLREERRKKKEKRDLAMVAELMNR